MYSMKPLINNDKVVLPTVMYSAKPLNPSLQQSSQTSGNSPLECLEQRQLDVLDKLNHLKSSVAQLADKYNVSTSPTSPSSSTAVAKCSVAPTPKNLGKYVTDIVISADPSNVPLSLIAIGQLLEQQYSVFKSTFVHSSATGRVRQDLMQLLTSNGGKSRMDCQIALTLVWKKVEDGPHLVVDPTRQTPIKGEANVIRYLARLLQPAYDETDILTSSQIDDFLDLAQMQILQGNNKEKSAAVRSLNSTLGKKDWLVGNEPSIADYVCWSSLHQTGQTSAPPANVKKWLNNCSNHHTFKTIQSLVKVES